MQAELTTSHGSASRRVPPACATRRNAGARILIPTFLLLASEVLAPGAANEKPLPAVAVDSAGHLSYNATPEGDRIPDFSCCGYAGGDRPIPDASVLVVVDPVPGDSTARIQRALDYVAQSQPGSNGVRGAVLLRKGRHEVYGRLRLGASGVVLRGQGMETVLVASGLDRATLISVAGFYDRTNQAGKTLVIRDRYVPVGASSFEVDDASGLNPGDTVNVVRPSTQSWIDRLGMTEFGGGQGDWRLTWKPGSRDLSWDRVVRSVAGRVITVVAPVTTAFEQERDAGLVRAYRWPGRIENVGIENLRLQSTFDAANPKDENHCWCAITLENAQDCWVRQVTAEHFAGSMVAIYESCKRVTVEDCISLAPVSEDGGYRRNTFFTMGQMTLFLRCHAEHGRHDFSVGFCAAGPNAFVQCDTSFSGADSGAIESWASGTLFDGVAIDGNGLSLANRGPAPHGAGWAAANSVLWQCSGAFVRCANPPGARNWAFGCWGEFEGDGVWHNSNGFMKPESLYVAQLNARLGNHAAARVKLMPRSTREVTNPTLDEAEQLIAASREPAGQLVDYIRQAPTRTPIPSEPMGGRLVDSLPAIAGQAPGSSFAGSKSRGNAALLITNGWLICRGRLLTGPPAEVAWWRGNTRPAEAASAGLCLTRFVPGRIGPGFTDDLNALVGSLIAGGFSGVDHHYGLWYERRRDDHERIRRMNGEVWPPFYEQPFSRSGAGMAWDGLSRYDLTKYNPWYWDRLKEFAGLCDQAGLVLFHQNYFQHNILEAGAHWADCPWRSANNINETGFPEPPPYAGDKRIFMAEQFYDVTHPRRRQIHRAYIRQCLDNFVENSNVIQFTSAEFTGPLPFVEFWLDTIREWEAERGRKAWIGLGCTRDVQDAILADPKRQQMISVVDFRYWWTTDQGTFAPQGGQNLAPRQFERQWKGGRPNDQNLAQMAAEYRRRFPDKPVICNFNQAGWAFLCAGGSMPRLPATTEVRLLEAIPSMRFWPEGSGERRWVLREPGKQYLACCGPNASRELDLTNEQARFNLYAVELKTGAVKKTGTTLTGGSRVTLPLAGEGENVFWLRPE